MRYTLNNLVVLDRSENKWFENVAKEFVSNTNTNFHVLRNFFNFIKNTVTDHRILFLLLLLSSNVDATE